MFDKQRLGGADGAKQIVSKTGGVSTVGEELRVRSAGSTAQGDKNKGRNSR